MNKLIVTTILFLGLAQQSMADWSYQCSNSEGQTLEVHVTPKEGSNIKVSATLTTPGFSEPFEGEGSHALYDTSADLKDSAGQPAILNVVTVIEYGGRCGRCSPTPDKTTYAKLILADKTQLNFTCQ